MIKQLWTLILIVGSLCTYAQDSNLRYYDYIYLDYIKSVKFHPVGDPLGMPIIGGPAGGSLLLSFDDVSGDDIKDFVYSVVHCDIDWQPSNLTEFEYLDGFSEERIENYEYSYKAKSIYTHYWVFLPNEDMRFIKSGNYLLKVYEDEDQKKLALTRRFMIADQRVTIIPDVVRPAMVSKSDTHQEIDFLVSHKGFDIRNPHQELTAVVIQNGNWNSAIHGVKPLFSRLEEQSFDYQNKIVFPALKEFRYIDMRGVRYPSPGITSVSEFNGNYEAVMEVDKKRGNMAYFEWNDINGNFVIQNKDESGRLFIDRINGGGITRLSTQEEQEYQQRINAARTDAERREIEAERQRDIRNLQQSEAARQRELFGEDAFVDDVNNLTSEYVDVLLQLYSPGEMYDEDIYIYGGLSDWQLKPEFKMVYNPAVSAYVAKIKLKQGYYDYLYAAVPKGSKEPDFEITEGNWYETENEYTILLYYRPFGSRYDRLIGFETFSSRY